MIHLITGQPGAGKTLLTLWWVRERAEKEDRAVYYSGISDLRVPGWIELEDPTQWHTLPTGSIIVIDEAQRVFRPRATGAQVPVHVAKLETHRHAGVDLYVITQHPKLLDANLRRLVGLHRHVMRAFGTATAVVHEWGECRPDPDLSREGSIKTTVRYPREVFAWYKSAEVHTHKARVPLRVWALLASPVILAGIGYGIYEMLSGLVSGEASPLQQQAQTIAGTSGDGQTVSAGVAGGQGDVMTAAEYVTAMQPRIPGLAYTAPIYDKATEVRHAPRPAACLATSKRCRCYTQQATVLDMPDDLCRQIVERGFFQHWDDEEAERASASASRREANSKNDSG